MKVLLFSSGSGSRGGGEIYLHHLAAGLSQLGHHVDALCSTARTMDELADNLCSFGRVRRVALTSTYLRPTRSLGAALDFDQQLRVSRTLQELSPEIIHINQQVAEDGLDFLLAARRSGIPFLSTIHIVHSANLLGARLGRLRDFVTSTVIRRANTLHITVAERARLDLLSRFDFLAPGRVRVVSNGVFFPKIEDARDRTRARWGIAPGEVVIGSVGRLEAQKSPSFALEIVSTLVRRGLPVRYIWIGEGSLRATFQEQAQQLGIAEFIKLDGWRNDVFTCLQGLDIFLLPSKFEGMPLALLEAMGAGLCCCVSNVDGMVEVIEHGRNGYLCPLGEVRQWSEQVETLVVNATLRVEVGNRAKEFARRRFSVDRMASETVKVYQKLIQSRQPGQGKVV